MFSQRVLFRKFKILLLPPLPRPRSWSLFFCMKLSHFAVATTAPRRRRSLGQVACVSNVKLRTVACADGSKLEKIFVLLESVHKWTALSKKESRSHISYCQIKLGNSFFLYKNGCVGLLVNFSEFSARHEANTLKISKIYVQMFSCKILSCSVMRKLMWLDSFP